MNLVSQWFSGPSPSPLGRGQPIVIGPSEPLVIGPSEIIQIGPSALIIVEPQEILIEAVERGAWEEKNWVRNGDQWTGEFAIRARGRAWRRFNGRIAMERGVAQPYIESPPKEIKKHPRGGCFHLLQGNWFIVNWHVPARDVDNAILYIEKVLDECLNG